MERVAIIDMGSNSIRFIVMGREMLNGTNRLYPENRDFIVCFVFFFRM